MSKEKEYWDSVIKQLNLLDSHYDGWIDKHFIKLPDTQIHIIELGCGWGDENILNR